MKPCPIKRPCKCGSTQGHIVTPTETIHAAKINCWNCGVFLKWISKDELERANNLGLVTTIDQLSLFE